MLGQTAAECTALLRTGCGATPEYVDAPLLMGLTPGKNITADPLPFLQQELAAFLIMRGPHAYLGWGEWVVCCFPAIVCFFVEIYFFLRRA